MMLKKNTHWFVLFTLIGLTSTF
ncbi:MAG: hypothetical protein RLZZ133_1615, partial [Pseudomonadota bacterium]